TQTAQSMHSSGSITSMLGPSRKASTGQTSTQSVCLHRMQASLPTNAMEGIPRGSWQERRRANDLTDPKDSPTQHVRSLAVPEGNNHAEAEPACDLPTTPSTRSAS